MKRALFLLLLSCSTAGADEKPIESIVALSAHAVELLFAIGAGERIVATTEYADYPEAALAIPRIGNYHGIQIERIVELNPDLILAWQDGNRVQDLQRLEALGFELLYTRPENPQQVADDVIRLGEVLGLQANAARVAKNYLVELEQLRADYGSKSKVKVFYQLWDNPLRTVGPASWIQTLLDECAAENVFADAKNDYPQISVEAVLVKKPEVILVPGHKGIDKIDLEFWNRWPEIPAVKHQRLFALNGDLLHRFTTRAVLGMRQLCEAIDSAR